MDRSTSAAEKDSGPTLSWSHTVGSGANRILIVGVSTMQDKAPTVTVSSVTYGGTALTRIGFQNHLSDYERIEMWSLPAPPAGTANVVVTLDQATGGCVAGAVSFFGVHQTTPLGIFASAQGSGTTPSITVSANSGEMVIDTVGTRGDANSLTAGAGQTEYWNLNSGKNDGKNAWGGGSTKAGAGSVTMSWTLGASQTWLIGAVPLKPFGNLGPLEPIQDTYIKLKEPGNNYGASTSLVIDRETTDLQRAILKFDMSLIPAGATIQSATLRMQATAIDGLLNISVYEVLQAWSEGTGNGTAGAANWNQRVSGTNWTTAGGTFNPTAVATLNTNSTGQHTWDVTSLVQAWYAGTKTNNGLMVASPDGGGNRTVTYDSREGTVKPILEIWYTTPTAIRLLSFNASGRSGGVTVTWETAHEVNNLGFHLYRATRANGPFTRLTEKLIPGSFSVMGKTYTYQDTSVTPWNLYYYQLEDIETSGKKALHGPICVDWDGDGIADDWEIAHGLNPRVKDGGGDPDGDGLTNLEEYKRGTDPLNPDTDGDGIPDGSDLKRDRVEQGSSSLLGRGVRVIATDETGMTLELATEGVLSEKVQVGGTTYDRIRVPSYIHGYTQDVGKPELPVKGILVDVPEGASASLRVGQCDTRSYPGVLVYPVPARAGEDRGGMGQVSEVFALDRAAYATDAFYPGAVAALGETFTFRGQRKLQLLFYPLSFNAVAGELIQYTKIRVRIDYEKPSLLRSALSKVLAASVPEAFEPGGEVSGLDGRLLSAWSPPSADRAYRVLVAEEGIYRLTPAWFTGQGIDPSGMDLSEVRLYNEGQEVAIAVHDGDGNNHLDAGDAIEFYGKAPSSSYSKYASYNVYWLTFSAGSGSPKRMAELDGTPGVGTIPGSFTFTLRHEENRWYWLGAPGDDALDRWFFYPFVDGSGMEGGGGAVSFTLSLPGVSGSGTLVIRLAGVYDTNHEVAVAVNGTPMGSITWSGIAFTEATFENVDFLAGANTVTLQCLSGTDSIAVDWFEAIYPRAFEASADALTFTADGGYRFQVSEFSGSDLELFEVTSPRSPQQITDSQVTGSGPYTVEFEPAEAGNRTYLVLASSALKTPAGITRDAASTLASSSNGADYILITHRMLGWDGSGSPQPWLKSLVSLRQGQGLRVKVVDIQDVFDEFSYGIETPQAVKDFLAYAYSSWKRPAPRYVPLVGDATHDPKGNWSWYPGDTTATYLSTYLAYTTHMGETVTDEWFTRVSGDDLVPDLYIGRLLAVTAAQAKVMVGKIVSYETAPNTKSWEKKVLLAADNATEAYESIFETINEDAAALLPASMGSPFKGYLADYLSMDDLTSDIKSRIDSGALLVNYAGHGSTQILAHEQIFDTGDVTELSNGGKLPLFVSMTCLGGYFAYPESWGFPSLAEALLRAEGKGAVAAFMPTGMTLPEGQHVLDRNLLDAIFTQDIRTIGPAISSAKQTLLANGAGYGEVSETFLLFGDPAMGLKVPLPRRVSGVAAEAITNGVSLTWRVAFDCNGKAVSGYNLYRATSAGGTHVKVNSALITGLSFEDTGLAGGGTYYYVVTAVDGDGHEEARSEALMATAARGSSGWG